MNCVNSGMLRRMQYVFNINIQFSMQSIVFCYRTCLNFFISTMLLSYCWALLGDHDPQD